MSATFLGVHRVTIQKWLKKYTDGGVAELLKIHPPTGRSSQLNEQANCFAFLFAVRRT